MSHSKSGNGHLDQDVSNEGERNRTNPGPVVCPAGSLLSTVPLDVGCDAVPDTQYLPEQNVPYGKGRESKYAAGKKKGEEVRVVPG